MQNHRTISDNGTDDYSHGLPSDRRLPIAKFHFKLISTYDLATHTAANTQHTQSHTERRVNHMPNYSISINCNRRIYERASLVHWVR